MYSKKELIKAIRKPREAVLELNAIYNWKRNGVPYNKDGIDHLEQDWDFLILLDALRYDIFKQESDLPGELRPVTSRGGGTQEWLRGNLAGRELTDTVYVNGNPQLDNIGAELDVTFHAVESVWRDEWDDELETVRPESVGKRVLDAAEKYPNKRIIAHFVQPHEPYIGETGMQFDFGGVIETHAEKYTEDILSTAINNLFSVTGPRMKRQAKEAGMTVDELYQQAYRENVQAVLPEVRRLFNELEGKFVVSSDHGEMLGEKTRPIPMKYYGHRIGVHVPALTEVPYLVYETGERRRIRDDGSSVKYENDNSQVAERLRSLGYAE